MHPSNYASNVKDTLIGYSESDLSNLNRSWEVPKDVRKVNIFIRVKDRIQNALGYWDGEKHTWRKVDGTAIEILGWKE